MKGNERKLGEGSRLITYLAGIITIVIIATTIIAVFDSGDSLSDPSDQSRETSRVVSKPENRKVHDQAPAERTGDEVSGNASIVSAGHGIRQEINHVSLGEDRAANLTTEAVDPLASSNWRTVTIVAADESWDEVLDASGYSAAIMSATEGTSDAKVAEFTTSSNRIAVRLPSGAYLACLIDPRGKCGPYREFDVGNSDRILKLSTVMEFAFQIRYLEQVSLKPIHGVKIDATRTGHPFEEGAGKQSFSTETDAGGIASLVNLLPGSFDFTVSKPGYKSVEYSLNLPGDWSLLSGRIDAGDAALDKLRTVGFQLVGDDAIGDWSAYQISHTHAGERVGFGADGRAELSVAHAYGSLYVKLWGPDDWGEIRYLDKGLPGNGEFYELYVGADRSLDVDLRIAESLKSSLQGKQFNITGYFVAANGDGVASTRDVNGEGIYSLRGIDGSPVVLAVQRHHENGPLPWVTKKVLMDPHGRTTCIVYLDQGPAKLRVVDHDGEPRKGVTALIREAPDMTRWLTGGKTDEDGFLDVPRTDSKCTGRFDWVTDDGSFAMAVGIPLNLDSSEPHSLTLGPLHDLSIRLTVNDQPRVGVHFAVRGYASDETISYLTTGKNGIAGPILLAEGSKGYVLLEGNDIWMDDTRFPLSAGETEIVGHEYGGMKAGADVDWSLIRCRRLGVSVADWIRAGRVSPELAANRTATVRVPVGRYLVTRTLGTEPREIVVTPGAVTDTDL